MPWKFNDATGITICSAQCSWSLAQGKKKGSSHRVAPSRDPKFFLNGNMTEKKERRPSISETMNPSLTHPSIQKIHIEHWIIQSLGQKQHTQMSIWGQEWMKGLFTKVWVRLKERNVGWWSTPWLVNSRRIGTLPWPKGEKKKKNGSQMCTLILKEWEEDEVTRN